MIKKLKLRLGFYKKCLKRCGLLRGVKKVRRQRNTDWNKLSGLKLVLIQ